MPFEMLTLTEATLTTFTGRTETHGKATVPAVSFRLRFSGPNTLLDLLSPTARKTFYMAAEGQEDLPGVDPTTPHLRSRDIKAWAPENAYEGWTVTVDSNGNEDARIEMGGCKVDSFACDLHDDPGMVDVELRVSTSNVNRFGAGWLWSMQRQKVFVMLAAPLTTQTNPEAGEDVDERQMTLDGSTGAEIGEPSQARRAAEAAFAGEPQRGDDWPFGTNAKPEQATQAFVDDVAKNGPGHSADPKPKKAKKPAAKKVESRRPAQYSDPMTGATWSGRGLKPKWLSVALEQGKSLADFQVKAH